MMTSVQFLLLAALVGEIGFMLAGMLAKKLRNTGVNGKSILAAYGLTFPVWIGALFYFQSSGQLNLPLPYIVCLVVWLGISYGINFGSGFISPFQSASEGTMYRFGFTAIFAVLADLFIFKTEFTSPLLITLAALFAGGIMLHISRVKQDFHSTKLVPLYMKLGFVALIALAEVATFVLFKYAATMQSNILEHNAAFQSVLYLMFVIMGGRILLRDTKQGYFPVLAILALIVMVLAGATSNAFAIAGLPVTLFVMFSLIRASASAMCDMKQKNVPFCVSKIAAFLLIIGGFASALLIPGF